MKNNIFDDMIFKINQIVEIVDKVPVELRNEVFKILFEAAKDSCNENMYVDEILKITEDGQSLKDFINERKPNSNIERSLIFVYHLEQKKMNSISAKEIAACYEICGLSEPGNLMQNLRDACSARYNYLESVQNCFATTQRGKEFCEK